MKVFNLITTALFLFSFQANADIFSQTFGEEIPPEGQVIVERPVDLTGSYKERRGKHGGLFSIGAEKFYPVDYTSQFPNSGYIEEITGTDAVTMVSGELGYKHNFSLGSIGLMLGYAHGNTAVSGDSTPAVATDRRLSLTRTSISANYAIDNLTEEPWIVPYVQGGIYQFAVDETKGGVVMSATSDYAFNYRLGILFQLNWIEAAIDPSTQVDGLRSTGLQNTFIDIYYIDHLAANNAADPSVANSEGGPNMRSSGEFGAGLKLEF